MCVHFFFGLPHTYDGYESLGRVPWTRTCSVRTRHPPPVRAPACRLRPASPQPPPSDPWIVPEGIFRRDGLLEGHCDDRRRSWPLAARGRNILSIYTWNE